ncbi:invasion associated locus B family protein [Roseicella aquatilis]|uniref:invasion associated locus B family protein n=1 Tax=Roseicella aquatilis TaxID=2527868 RepID=UPI001404C8DB|nr:invasion associated locus B family protein [Roseicella aquatilis]
MVPAPEPERTTASFGDWVVRCEKRQGGGGEAARNCEMTQGLQDGRGQPFGQFALGRPAPSAPWRLVLLVPVDVGFEVPPRLVPGEGPAPIPLTFRACAARGCVADATLDAAALARLRARDGQGRAEYRNAAGAEVVVPFSFRGFAQAVTALERAAD